jgi:hypothetical protein
MRRIPHQSELRGSNPPQKLHVKHFHLDNLCFPSPNYSISASPAHVQAETEICSVMLNRRDGIIILYMYSWIGKYSCRPLRCGVTIPYPFLVAPHPPRLLPVPTVMNAAKNVSVSESGHPKHMQVMSALIFNPG